MPKQRDAFVTVLCEIRFEAIKCPPCLRLDTLPPDAQAMVVGLFRKLGGVASRPRLTPGGWDSSFEGGLVVEYDERQRFNRYRATNLQGDWSHGLPWRRAYLDYCTALESDCTKARGWRRPGAEARLSGCSARLARNVTSTALDLRVGGVARPVRRHAPRRRPYGSVRLGRPAVYDDVGGVALGQALSSSAPLDQDALR